MMMMMWRGKVDNFLLFFLQMRFSTRGVGVIHRGCGQFLFENEAAKHFIHHFRFWCKVTKFIFFFGMKVWKTD